MKVKIAATQMSCSWQLNENIEKAKRIVVQAAEDGANIILLQELFQSPYFCIEYDEKNI
jgi:N-carbamoylputrescine amidase